MRLGAITLVVMALIMAAAFNLGKFPGFAGTSYRAEFKDASGLHKGNMVQVGGIRVGRVQDVEHGVEFGKDTSASVEVLSLLGEKYLELQPAGTGQLSADDVIPVDRTQSAYDIVGVFTDLTTTTERIDTDQLAQALDVVADTTNKAAPEIEQSFGGLARRADPGAAQGIAEREQDPRRSQRRPRVAHEEQRPGLQGGAAPQGGRAP